MFVQEFGIDPNEVEKLDIDEGNITALLKDGSKKSKDLLELEEKGFGRRENCRRCEINIPVFADLACGKWGTEAEVEKATFIEVCSEKGKKLIDGAEKGGFIEVVQPDRRSIQVRQKKDKTETERAISWRVRDFEPLLALDPLERLEYWVSEFDKCIKCYGCRDACPICYCDNCLLEASRGFVHAGEIPPEAAFPITRLAHVADSCVNCGQCQDACPMELPLSKLFSLLNSNLCSVFEYTPGLDVEQGPPLITARIEELQVEDTFLDLPSMNRMLQGKS
jgi:formate dehydrogenase subunit beta